MFSSVILFALAALFSRSMAYYVLQDDYSASNFFNMFEFFTASDPTHGFVNFVDQVTAQADNLISTNGNGQITIAVDSTNVAPSGRNAVRLTSNSVYNHGLIILDLAHMPEGCGTWPAFWSVGPNWPNEGEVDIIEGVNEQATNAMTLHTGPGCSITNNGNFTGNIATSSCDVNASGQPTNAGCSIDAPSSNTYGSGFNAAGGGVYATEWTSNAISVYFFTANSIPSDISNGNPNPSSWPESSRLAQFQGACNLDSAIQNQQLVFDMTFCGDWAGGVWGSSSCAAQSSSCSDFVANNPSAFADAYWEINSLKVYQDNGAGNAPFTSASTTTAGPTGIASGLPSIISSLAPIPLTSSAIQTTFVVQTTPTSTSTVQPLTAGWGAPSETLSALYPPGVLDPTYNTVSVAAVSSTTSTTTIPSTTEAPAPITQEPATTETPTTTTPVPPTTTTTQVPSVNPYFSANEPVPASWFGPGAGIPTDWADSGNANRKNRRSTTSSTIELDGKVSLIPAAKDYSVKTTLTAKSTATVVAKTKVAGGKKYHQKHLVGHMGGKAHRHVPVPTLP